ELVVYILVVEAVRPTLIGGPKGKISTHPGIGRHQAAQQEIRTEVHMVMAIHVRRGRAVEEAGELVGLSAVRIGEMFPQEGIIHELRVPVAPEEACQVGLGIHQARQATTGGEGFGEIQMQSDIEIGAPCQTRCALRIAHEDHQTSRSDSPRVKTLQGRVGLGHGAAQVIGIDNQHWRPGLSWIINRLAPGTAVEIRVRVVTDKRAPTWSKVGTGHSCRWICVLSYLRIETLCR
ncbi:MAG: hypothetical protein L0219_22505, partial [Phycisphaerales bacterium]|nr:hypothetical protein [Phycisphaerales bacterium]